MFINGDKVGNANDCIYMFNSQTRGVISIEISLNDPHPSVKIWNITVFLEPANEHTGIDNAGELKRKEKKDVPNLHTSKIK